MRVPLTPWEYKAAVDLAVTRMAVSIDQGTKDIAHESRDWFERLRVDVLGACGEIAVAKAVNKFWSPSVNTMHRIADVGTNIEVRATDRENGSLIIRGNDDEDRWYFLVTGEPPEMVVRGYIRGADARRDEWVRNPHGHRTAWFVPQSALLPMPTQEAA